MGRGFESRLPLQRLQAKPGAVFCHTSKQLLWQHTSIGEYRGNRSIIHPKFARYGLTYLGAHLTATFTPPMRLLDHSHAQERRPVSRPLPPACPARPPTADH